jgi:hypothetical protein
MTQKRITNKRTTPEMSAEYRLKKWLVSTCPYCGGGVTLRVDTHKTDKGPITGLHFKCLTDPCNAENFFSEKRNLLLAGVD